MKAVEELSGYACAKLWRKGVLGVGMMRGGGDGQIYSQMETVIENVKQGREVNSLASFLLHHY